MMESTLMQRCPSIPRHERLRDAWNHAIFLVKVAYDLEWAASQFELLEREAPNCKTKAILLLNIGITYSLLAEYRRAEKAFQKALPLHPFTSPLAHFFLGLVRFELTEYEQAQISFMLCAHVLRQTNHARDYRQLGLDFTLSHDLVVENEEIAAYEWTLKQKGRYGYRLLNRLPAPSIFDTTVLDDLPNVWCKRVARQPTHHSKTQDPTFSTYSRNVSSIMRIADSEASRPVRSLTIRTPPLIPPTSVQRRPMVPRTAQPEPSDLHLLTQFLRYTGPDSSQAIRANKPSVPLMSVAGQTTTSRIERRSFMSSKCTDSAQTPPSQTQDKVESSGLVHKFSFMRLKKTESIRNLTGTVFSTPLDRLGAANVAPSRRGVEGGRVVHRPGPQRRPAIHANSCLPTIVAQRAVNDTTTENSRGSEVPQQSRERISMDSHMIFSHGGLIM